MTGDRGSDAAGGPRLLLFTRFPEAGQVKTRLIPALGPEGAAALHRHLTERTIATMRETGFPLEIWVTGAPAAAFRPWLGDTVTIHEQGGGDLGERMARALAGAPAVLTGSDLPLLEARHLSAAAAVLRRGKVALGPAEDGGYYLVGVPGPVPAVFTDMAWSTHTVLAETVRRLGVFGIAYELLEMLPDLDRPDDLLRFPALRGRTWRHDAEATPTRGL